MEINVSMVITMVISFTIASFITRKYDELPTKNQKECNHDWHILTQGSSPKFSIYCPKCKYEKKVTEEQWAIMRLDKEYEERNKEINDDTKE